MPITRRTVLGLLDAARWLGPKEANPGLKYIDSTANGYGLAQFSAEALEVQLVTVAKSYQSVTASPAIEHKARFRLPLWQPGKQPDLQGPEFEYGAPLPL